MSSVKVTIPGFKEIKSFFSKGMQLSTFEVEFTQAVLLTTAVIDKRVKALYNAPGIPSEVMIGKSVKPEALSKTFIRYGLQYRDKKIPLIKYPYSVRETKVRNAIPFQTLTSEGPYYKPINKARIVSVRVKKQKGPNLTKRNVKFKKFLVNNSYMKGIFTRDTSETWEELPTRSAGGRIVGGKRAKYHELYGPSLADLAETVFKHDSEVQKALDNIPDRIIKSMDKYYG